MYFMPILDHEKFKENVNKQIVFFLNKILNYFSQCSLRFRNGRIKSGPADDEVN